MASVGALSQFGDLLREVARSCLRLLTAEVEALLADVESSGRHAAAGLVRIGAAFGVALCGVGAATATLIAVLSLWLPVWLAALSVTLFLFLLAWALYLWARAHFGRVESPAQLFRQRLESHQVWWEEEVVGDAGRPVDDERRTQASAGDDLDPEAEEKDSW